MEIENFYKAANAYCEWAEGAASSPELEVVEALKHLTTLYRLALSLPDVYGEEDAPEILELDERRVARRFSQFPFQLYVVCFNPLELEEKPVVGAMSDDLSDIWRDLRGGVDLYRLGHVSAAAWHWRFHFLLHWGQHVVAASAALHAWLAENPGALPSNNSLQARRP
ncbi:MAG: DUF5063 domain-containing protein [Pseudomonadota bacterium]